MTRKEPLDQIAYSLDVQGANIAEALGDIAKALNRIAHALDTHGSPPLFGERVGDSIYSGLGLVAEAIEAHGNGETEAG